MEGFARPDFNDEPVDNIVIILLSKKGGCFLRLL